MFTSAAPYFMKFNEIGVVFAFFFSDSPQRPAEISVKTFWPVKLNNLCLWVDLLRIQVKGLYSERTGIYFCASRLIASSFQYGIVRTTQASWDISCYKLLILGWPSLQQQRNMRQKCINKVKVSKFFASFRFSIYSEHINDFVPALHFKQATVYRLSLTLTQTHYGSDWIVECEINWFSCECCG